MKATELRIGNWIYYTSDKDTVEVIINTLLNFSETYYKPIPLTEQWLKDFGFEDVKEKAYHYTLKIPIDGENKNEIIGIIVNNNTICCAITNGHWSSNNVFHVHQLQNLFFSLVGEELALVTK